MGRACLLRLRASYLLLEPVWQRDLAVAEQWALRKPLIIAITKHL